MPGYTVAKWVGLKPEILGYLYAGTRKAAVRKAGRLTGLSTSSLDDPHVSLTPFGARGGPRGYVVRHAMARGNLDDEASEARRKVDEMKMKKTKKTEKKGKEKKATKKAAKKTAKKPAAKKTAAKKPAAKKPAKKAAKKTTAKGDKAQIADLVKQLGKCKDDQKAKNIRRKLRKLGHKGGLRKK